MITPEQLAGTGTESGHQKALFCWIALNRDKYPKAQYAFAIPNGGQRGIVTGARLKAEGLKPGVPDIFLPVSKYIYSGLFIELKTSNGKLSQDQISWIDYLTEARYRCEVCYGWEAARDTIIEYLK